jgi:Transposase IS4
MVVLTTTSAFIVVLLLRLGKNKANVDIHPEALGLPTTMKAVVNAVMQSGVAQDISHGYRVLSMDNRYQCPELAVGLRDRCKILSTGTCRKNRKGWPSHLLGLTPISAARGRASYAYDRTNELLCLQWRDNKVVNCVTTLIDTEEGHCRRRCGSELLTLTVPKPLGHYHKYMGGVDRCDQRRMHLGGFARKSHFKKWYKRAFFAVMDCMLLSALAAWSMSIEHVPTRQDMSRHEFYSWIADDLLNYSDEKKRKKGRMHIGRENFKKGWQPQHQLIVLCSQQNGVMDDVLCASSTRCTLVIPKTCTKM